MKLHSEIGKILISFLEAHLELSKVNDSQTEGKQATNLIMAINDLEELFKTKPGENETANERTA